MRLSQSLLLLAAAIPAFAADSEQLPPPGWTTKRSDDPGQPVLVVTADRQTSDASRTTASISVLDAGDLADRGFPLSPWQALRGTAGVDVTDSATTSIRLRGTASSDTQYLLDGIPVSDPTNTQGTLDAGVLGIAGIERIEVVRGTQSGLYGSRAVGGVVNLLTARPTALPQQQVLVEGGSLGTLRGEGVATGSIDRTLGYAFSIGGLTSSGISARTDANADGRDNRNEHDASKRGTGNARLEWSPREDVTLYAAARGDALNQDYDGGFPTDPNDDASWKQNRLWRGSAGGNAHLGNATLGLDAAHTLVSTTWIGSYADVYRGDENHLSAHAGYDVLTPDGRRGAAIDRLNLSLGSDLHGERAQIDGSALDERASTRGVWGQALVGDRWFEASLVGRGERHSQAGSIGTWRSGLALFPASWSKLSASAASGYRAPSLYELYAPFGGNADLEAQRNLAYDAGHEARLPGDLTVTDTWFRTDYRQGIDWVGSGYANTGPYRVDGIENAVSWRDGREGFRVAGSYTYQRSDLDSRFTQLPHHKASVAPGWWGDRWWTRAQFDAVGRRQDVGSAEDHGYLLVGAAVGYRFTKEVEGYLRGENLGNTRYQQVAGYTTAPINGSAGVSATF